MTVPNLALNSGQTIPQLGFGVFKIVPAETAAAVSEALRVGYRHIDTAEMYGNEKEVGEAVRASGWIAAKSSSPASSTMGFIGPMMRARPSMAPSMRSAQTVDLFLIHWPLPTLYGGDFVSTWLTLEEFYRDGRARSIGVSNFQVTHVRRLAQESESYRPSTKSKFIRTCATRRFGRRTPSLGSSPRRGRRLRRQGSQRSHDRCDRQSSGQDACAGGASLAHATRGRHLP